jgi:DNA mismatch repair protein MutS
MHAVEEGPANQSYGIQVAALAGIPNAVVRAARKQLREFEQRAAVDPLQPDLFAQGEPQPAEPEPHPALDQLAAIDPDSLTPREALDALYALKRPAASEKLAVRRLPLALTASLAQAAETWRLR